MHYAVPVLLHRAGMLAHFYTDAYVGPGSAWHLPAQAGPVATGSLASSPFKAAPGPPGRQLAAGQDHSLQPLWPALRPGLDSCPLAGEREHVLWNMVSAFVKWSLRHNIFPMAVPCMLFMAALPLF